MREKKNLNFLFFQKKKKNFNYFLKQKYRSSLPLLGQNGGGRTTPKARGHPMGKMGVGSANPNGQLYNFLFYFILFYFYFVAI
jgi:hypothetical protein